MKPMLLGVLLLFCQALWAQDTHPEGTTNTIDELTVDLLEPLNFNYTNASELLEPKIISNAIRLNLNMKQEPCYVFCQAFFNNSGMEVFANNLALLLRYTNSPSANNEIMGEKRLSSSPVLLISLPPMQSPPIYNFLYDVKLYPPTNFTETMDCSFTLTFTITRQ